MKIRLRLPFPQPGLSFSQFIPTKNDGALNAQLEEGSALLFVTEDDRTQAAVSETSNADCFFNHLNIELSLPDPEEAVHEALLSGNPNEASKRYTRRVFDIAIGLHRQLISWWRNTFRHYELEHVTYHKGEEQRLLSEWGTEWLTPDNAWAPFEADKKWLITTAGVIRISTRSTMERAQWESLGTKLSSGRQPRMPDVLITNAYEHVFLGNYRIAVVEAVTALETAFKQQLEPILRHAQRETAFEKSLFKKLISKHGLRFLTEYVLPSAVTELGIGKAEVSALLPAVHLRNEIIHGPKRKVTKDEAKRTVEAIDALLEAMTIWHQQHETPKSVNQPH